MTTKFTPGPWVYNQHWDGRNTISSENHGLVCHTECLLTSDANLITTAPDMYRLLSFIAETQKKNYGDGMGLHLDMIGVAEKINDLLAKARGEL